MDESQNAKLKIYENGEVDSVMHVVMSGMYR